MWNAVLNGIVKLKSNFVLGVKRKWENIEVNLLMRILSWFSAVLQKWAWEKSGFNRYGRFTSSLAMSYLVQLAHLERSWVHLKCFVCSVQVRNWCTILFWWYSAGLKYHDCYYETEQVKEAIRRLPQNVQDERTFRMVRALQLSMQKTVLPKEQWTKFEEVFFTQFLYNKIPVKAEFLTAVLIPLQIMLNTWVPISVRVSCDFFCSFSGRLLPEALPGRSFEGGGREEGVADKVNGIM